MRSIFIITTMLLSIPLSTAQIVHKVQEKYIVERTIGKRSFIQADVNGDGEMEFMADANNVNHAIIGKISGNDIQVEKFFDYPDYSNPVRDVRYEDSNGDGQMEFFILVDDVGLIQYDTSTYLPIDTLTMFENYDSYRGMVLTDINHDLINEWVLLDNSDGIVVINPSTHQVIWSNTLLDGNTFLIENLDLDTALELVLVKNTMITIIDIETLVVEHTISALGISQVDALDMDADGNLELVYQYEDFIAIYDHATQTIVDEYEIDFPFILDYFIPYNLDGDPALELLLTSASFSKMVEVNTFPFAYQTHYDVEGIEDIGFFLGRALVTGEPDKLLFTLGDYQVEYAGLVRYDPVTHMGKLTNIRCEPNAQLSYTSSESLQTYLFTRPAGARDEVINIITADSFSTFKQIRGEDIFNEPNISLDAPLFSFHGKGIAEDIIAFSNNSHLSFYNLSTDHHQEFYSYVFSQFLLDDLDFNGSMELLLNKFNGIQVHKNTTGYNFEFDFTTIPLSSNFNIRTAQLDDSKEKELIAFYDDEFFVFNGKTGGLIRQLNHPVNVPITDFTSFTDGRGTYYLALMGKTHVYIYDFTNEVPGISFPHSANEYSRASIQSISHIENDTAYHTLFTFTDTFKIYTPSGEILFRSEKERGISYDLPRIVINDHDHDFNANIFTSSQNKFTEYEYEINGDYIEPFYLTSVYPKDSVILHHSSPFILEFSEIVSSGSIPGNMTLTSAKSGLLNFTVESLTDLQVKISYDHVPDAHDTITISIHGGLQSKLARHLDTNFDGLCFQDKEPPIVATYVIDTMASHNDVAIVSLQPLPEFVYTGTNRHIPISVRSVPDPEKSTRIASVYYGIQTDSQPNPIAVHPVDSIYDEFEEEVWIPLNTFHLHTGHYTYYIVAKDYLDVTSDTFFFDIKVIEESGYYDKNTGGDFHRTNSIPNNTITYNLRKVKELNHANFTKLSHVVGGSQNMYYVGLAPGCCNGTIRNIDLTTFETNWIDTVPMYNTAAEPHLNNGILYLSNTYFNPTDPEIAMYDIHTGAEILKRTYNSNSLNEASPITNEDYIILPDYENNGLYCLDRWTGEEKWHAQSSPFNSSEGAPSIFDSKVYSVRGSHIQCFEIATGAELWNVQVEGVSTFISNDALIDTLNRQVIWSGEDHLYAYDADSGLLRWKVPSFVNYEKPVLYRNEIFHFSNDTIRVFNATTGALLRQRKPNTYVEWQPVAANGKLFIPLANTFEVWDAKTLETLWIENFSPNDISIIDQFLILRTGTRFHIYESFNQCCNPTIEWTETEFFGFFGEAITRKYTFDTLPVVQNGIAYYEILASDFEIGGNWQKTDMLIREQGGKIYQWFDSGEEILIDFNLDLNDHFTMNTGIELTVMDIDTIILENGESRKRLELHCDDWPPIYWIDGIGSTAGLALNYVACMSDIGGALLCLSQDGNLLYDNPNFNTCWLQIVSTSELDMHGISYAPNPAIDRLTIEDPEHQLSSVSIYDTGGKFITSSRALEIDISNLSAGIYQLCFILNSGERRFNRLVKL